MQQENFVDVLDKIMNLCEGFKKDVESAKTITDCKVVGLTSLTSILAFAAGAKAAVRPRPIMRGTEHVQDSEKTEESDNESKE